MRKYPHYGTANDNSFIGDIVRFIDQHAHLKPFEKDLLVNRITERYTGDSVEVKIAHLAMGIAVPEMFATKFADELDAIPLGTAEEERQRAKLWLEDAGRYARNEAYWREKRAYPAEECVRMLVDEIAAQGGCKEPLTEKCHKLIGHIRRWGRPENPEQYHEIPTESAKIDDLKWLDNVVPRTANVSKPFAEQRFGVVQEFSVKPFKNIDPEAVRPAQMQVEVGVDKKAQGLYRKYNVERVDGKPLKGQAFVLETGDPNTHPALLVWAQTLQHKGYEKLAGDVLRLIPETAGAELVVKNTVDLMINLPVARRIIESAKQLIQSWLDKQGHDRCWYHPDIFSKLADLFGLKPTVDPQLPSVEAFQGGCQRYQLEQYGKAAAPTGITDADVLKLISAYKDLGAHNARTDWNAISNLIGKMEAAIAENAKTDEPWNVKVKVPQERLDRLEHDASCLHALKEHETHSRSMSFAELLDVHQRGAASLQHIGYLFLAAMREDKCFTIKMGPSVEISGSTGTSGGEAATVEEKPKKRRVILQDMSAHQILGHYDVDDFNLTDDGFGNITLRFSAAGVPQLKIVQGANGDYFVQHKGGLWRIEANGVIGAGVDAWRSFCNVLAELGTPAGVNEMAHVVLDRARFDELLTIESRVVDIEQGLALYRQRPTASDAAGGNDLDAADAWEANHVESNGALVSPGSESYAQLLERYKSGDLSPSHLGLLIVAALKESKDLTIHIGNGPESVADNISVGR